VSLVGRQLVDFGLTLKMARMRKERLEAEETLLHIAVSQKPPRVRTNRPLRWVGLPMQQRHDKTARVMA
jgi:hypothetical protein